jgi:hypothetical protein
MEKTVDNLLVRTASKNFYLQRGFLSDLLKSGGGRIRT